MDKKLGNKHIRSAEYNKERMSLVQQMIIDGQDAEAVYKYAYKLKKDVEQEVLNFLLTSKNKDEVAEMQQYYRIVCRFVDMLAHVALLGKRKANELMEK